MNWINKLRLWSIKTLYPNRVYILEVPNDIDLAAMHKLSNALKSMSLNKFMIINKKIKITVIKE